MNYRPTIGLEIHAELKTNTKLFCDSKNDPDEKIPNINICPVCVGHPGTLPVINKEAVKHILKIGLAVRGNIANFTEFDRKNYFYPDIPKGYQISQYKFPLISEGSLKGVAITRIHLEEDTARSTHDTGDNYSLIDFNRSGIPLMELVTEPVIENAKQAISFARELQLLLRYLDIGNANMEKGEMRVEANVSISLDNKKGTKVEVKNLNSFRSVERAINYEINRQTKLLDSAGRVVQETRGWDEVKQCTYSQRIKEESQDYRYFPEPDLLKFIISEVFSVNRENKEIKDIGGAITKLNELPWEKRSRYKDKYCIKGEDIETLVQNEVLGNFFDRIALNLKNDKKLVMLASNYVTSDLIGLFGGESITKRSIKNITPEGFASIIQMIAKNEISSRGAKDILALYIKEGGEPKKIAGSKGLFQKSDEKELSEIVIKIIKENKKAVEEYKNGKESVLKYLVGQGMKETKGSANPEVLQSLFLSNIHK